MGSVLYFRRGTGLEGNTTSMSKQEETRDRVLDLVESIAVGQPIPAERQLAIDLGVSRADFEDHSFYELLRERYGITIASGTQSIEPTVTSDEESEVLGVPLHTPAFLFERTTVSESGRIVEFVRSVYRGDRYRLVAELVPQRGRN